MSMDIIARGLAGRLASRLGSGAPGEGSALVTFRGTDSGSASRSVESKLRDSASLKDFGAVGNGVADDTAAVQAWATHCAVNHLRGYAPPGTYRLTATIVVPISEGFTLRGAGPTQTVFLMATDNTIIFDLGGAAGDTYLRYVDFGGFTLTYANVQTSAMTGALPVRFSAMMFQSRVTEIRFYRGYYCMSVASGILAPWGSEFNNLFLEREVTGGFYDMLAAGASAVPNNFYGRLGADALNCTQTLFRNFKGYNTFFATFEVFSLRSPMFHFSSDARFTFGAIKMENADLTGISNWNTQFGTTGIINMPSGALTIGQFDFSGSDNKLNPTQIGYLFVGAARSLRIDFLKIDATQAVTNFYVFGTNNASQVRLGDYYRTATAFSVPWQYNGGTETSARLTIEQDNNSRVSDNKGDAAYVMAQGDPCFVQWETALTAPRIMDLPNSVNDLFNGYRVRVTSRGAVNGANTLAIRAGATTVHTLTADNTWVELMWRKNGASGVGWYKVAGGTI